MALLVSDDPLERVQDLAALIEEDAAVAERQGHLTDRVVDAITDAGLYRMLIPRSLGGLEVDPVTFYRTIEAVARLDGSTGWCQFIQSGGAILGSALDDATAEEIFGDAGTRGAGGVFPFGKAVAVDGGYTVSGRWPYASGCWHATFLIGFCATFDGDTPRPGLGEMPEVRVVIVPRSDVVIHETWDVSGLAGTGSHDIEMREVFVPERRAWLVGPRQPGIHYQAPMYTMPFFTFFAWAIAPVALGVAQCAIDAVMELAAGKTPVGMASSLRERPLYSMQLAQATAKVRSARSWLHQLIQRAYDAAAAGTGSDLRDRAELQLAATNATQSAREAVELCYLAGGGTANYRSSVLQRCLRDIHAITQHVGTSINQYEDVGRMLSGFPPRLPLILL